MAHAYITTDASDSYHTSTECPAYQRGILGNTAQGIEPKPVRAATPDEINGKRKPCPECGGGNA